MVVVAIPSCPGSVWRDRTPWFPQVPIYLRRWNLRWCCPSRGPMLNVLPGILAALSSA